MERPNFVLILTDDMGSGDLPCVPGGDPAVVCGGTASFGHPYAHMPHLAALQRDGARFTAAYTLGLTCSPSRNAWLTGRMPAEVNVGVEGLPHPPVSEMLRAAGYATAHFGKWNIGKTATAIDTSKNIAAGTYGFDVIDEKGWPNGTAPRPSRLEGRYCVRGVDHSDRTWYGRDGGYFDLAVSWLHEVAKPPFYMDVWAMTPHRPVPMFPPRSEAINHVAPRATRPRTRAMPWLGDRFRDRFSAEGFDRHLFPAGMQRRFDDHARLGAVGYKAKVKHSAQPGGSKARVLQRYNTSLADGMATYLGEMYGLDVHIGRLLAALDETRVRDNTVVLFSSDHGPEQTRENELGSTGPARGGKQSAFEGGIRLPYIIRWPGRIPPGYVDSTSLIGNVDWAPTIARLARLPDSSTPRFDGVSVARRWKGSAGDRSGGALFAWCLHGHKIAIRGPRGLKAFAWAERTFGNRRAAAARGPARGCPWRLTRARN
mmetsp:Transcript_24357/g.77134  ORF Transcript_24357/g.77134 Transcript_24357/m.77134 type:complete len:485 (+) Transcript_24357:15-1469(+)